MRHDQCRCSGGCGAIVQLPSMKASTYRAKCDACHRKAAEAAKASTLRDPAPLYNGWTHSELVTLALSYVGTKWVSPGSEVAHG